MQAEGFVRHFGSRDLRTTCGDQLKGGDLEWEPGLRGPHFAPSSFPCVTTLVVGAGLVVLPFEWPPVFSVSNQGALLAWERLAISAIRFTNWRRAVRNGPNRGRAPGDIGSLADARGWAGVDGPLADALMTALGGPLRVRETAPIPSTTSESTYARCGSSH